MINLSRYTGSLVDQLAKIKPKPLPSEHTKISVSQTVSFFAIAYEKIRNAVEYRESHLIRRSAIERILKRRLLLNPSGKGEAENLIRELLWARYFPNEALGQEDIEYVQKIIDKYINRADFRNSEFLIDLLTCEIEEVLSPEESQRNVLETFFIYQVLKDKIQIEHMEEDHKNAYFYVALEKIFNKNDIPYLRYHLFKLLNQENRQKIDSLIANPYTDRMRRFIKQQIPPFKILFDVLKKNPQKMRAVLEQEESLWPSVSQICEEKYKHTASRLRTLAVKAIIYIFLTKMIFALILEYPMSLYFYGEVNYVALGINTLFPPILMFLIIGMTGIPGAQNTKRISDRMIEIINADKSFETSVSFILKKPKDRRPVRRFIFSLVYILTFIVTFRLLYLVLFSFKFNIISQLIFVFFVSLVAFFAYRIRQVAKEYELLAKDNFFRPFVDFFFLPFLSIGKFLSSSIARLNFLGAILDFLIEAPFKLIIEVVEEWINFVRARREEIA